MNFYEVTYWVGNFETLCHDVVLLESPDDREEALKQIKESAKILKGIDVDVTYIQSIELFKEEEE